MGVPPWNEMTEPGRIGDARRDAAENITDFNESATPPRA
jgi:hypothetical protein